MSSNRLNLVKKFIKENRRMPSYSEMAKMFGLSSKKAIHDIVNKWVEEGFFTKEDGKPAPTSKLFGIPYVGIIKAGYPILADENKTYYNLDEFLLNDKDSAMLLKVSGDSMIDAGIFEGDFVIINRLEQGKEGDIVLAEIDNEWTLKILRKDLKKRKLYLEAANADYLPFYPKHELKLHGTVKAVIRKYSQ